MTWNIALQPSNKSPENAPFIVSRPKNKTPKPVNNSPKFFTFSFLKNDKITPMTARRSKYLENGKLDNETNKPVTVVPIYPPKMIQRPWKIVITPALRKPMVMTLVAPED